MVAPSRTETEGEVDKPGVGTPERHGVPPSKVETSQVTRRLGKIGEGSGDSDKPVDRQTTTWSSARARAVRTEEGRIGSGAGGGEGSSRVPCLPPPVNLNTVALSFSKTLDLSHHTSLLVPHAPRLRFRMQRPGGRSDVAPHPPASTPPALDHSPHSQTTANPPANHYDPKFVCRSFVLFRPAPFVLRIVLTSIRGNVLMFHKEGSVFPHTNQFTYFLCVRTNFSSYIAKIY